MINNMNTASKNGQRRKMAIIAVVIIGVLGFLYWNNFMQPAPPKNSTATTLQPQQVAKTVQPAPNRSVVKIEDWGIELTIPDVLSDTGISFVERASEGQAAYAFTTTRIQGLGGKCLEQPFGDTITVNRLAERPTAPDSKLLNQEPINSYYYTVGSQIAGCSAFSQNGAIIEVSPIENNDRTALQEMAATLKAIE